MENLIKLNTSHLSLVIYSCCPVFIPSFCISFVTHFLPCRLTNMIVTTLLIAKGEIKFEPMDFKDTKASHEYEEYLV